MSSASAQPSDTALRRKARGAFFTPPTLCDYLVNWGVRSPVDRILDPACGDGAFLVAAAERLATLAGDRRVPVHGVELHQESARLAAQLLTEAGHLSQVTTADFFTVHPDTGYDVVVGNPPYVRYQDYVGKARARGREAAARVGVRLTGLASSWAAFTVHACSFLRPGGRLGLVLPAELLTVNYAAEVRRFLMERFGRLRVVLFKERVFPGVLEEVVLLLAEGDGPTDKFDLQQVRSADDLGRTCGEVSTWEPTSVQSKWMAALLPSRGREMFYGLQDHKAYVPLETLSMAS